MARTYMLHTLFGRANRWQGGLWQTRGTEPWSGSARATGSDDAVEWFDDFVRLKIMPDPAQAGHWLEGHIATGEIGGPQRFEFTYGWAEVMAKVGQFHGGHCSGWLQQTEGDYFQGQSEIDIFECFGAHNPDRKAGVNMYHNVYYRPDNESPITSVQLKTLNEPGEAWYREYHKYKVHWTPKRYTFYIDNEVVGVITKGLSNRPKFAVLSMLTRDFEMKNLGHHPLPYMDVRSFKVWREH